MELLREVHSFLPRPAAATAKILVFSGAALTLLLVYTEPLLPSRLIWKTLPSDVAANRQLSQSKGEWREINSLTEDSYMIYSAYWDRRPRNSTPELMILAISRCRGKNDTLPYATVKDSSGKATSRLQLEAIDMDDEVCPGGYKKDCTFFPYQLFKPVPDDWISTIGADNKDHQDVEVTVFAGGNRSITVRPTWSAERYEPTLTVCVMTIYWYNDWRRLLIFTAMWRAQGAAHFYFYFNSGTKEVHQLLKYFEQQGYATVLPYPDLPSNEKFDPNWATFRMANSLGVNDCALRTKSKWAAHVDIDEFILMHDTNVKLADWLMQQPDDDVGELSFWHHQIFFEPRFMDNLLKPDVKVQPQDVGNALVFWSGRSPKVIFRTRGIRSDSTHWVFRFQKGFRKQTIDSKVAYYAHFRWNFDRKDAGNTTSRPILTTSRAAEVAHFMDRSIADVFGVDLPKYNGSAIDRLTKDCAENWQSQKTKCMVPLRACRDGMLPLADWVFEPRQAYAVL